MESNGILFIEQREFQSGKIEGIDEFSRREFCNRIDMCRFEGDVERANDFFRVGNFQKYFQGDLFAEEVNNIFIDFFFF